MAVCLSWWKYIPVLCFTVQSVKTVPNIKSSKACYGAEGLHCTRHDLRCRDTQSIAITDAYYTANTECDTLGLSRCSVNPGGVTEFGYFRFTVAELAHIYSGCSMLNECLYPAPRRSAGVAFSVVKYQCIETTNPFNIKCEHDQVPTKDNVGAIVGGVAVTVLAVSVVTFFIVRLIRKRGRNMHETKNESPSPPDLQRDNSYCLATNIPQEANHDAGDLKAQSSSSDYDYATVDGMAPQSGTCDPAASAAESGYNLIDDKPLSLTTDYDKTSAVGQATHTGGRVREDEYGYNLFQTTNIKPLQNDYDTAASATKAVAQMSGNDTSTEGDNYDHLSRAAVASGTLGSPYDTAGIVR
ncbi:uncharacterized protein [Haliotis asinina]|uniref:uncharacterized protein n=1 Tax=Haliotis asinina TaxID=109174 RepID=UPI003531B8A4